MANELKWAADYFSKYGPLYLRFDNYYQGDHQQILSDEIRNTFGKLFGGLRDNLCPVVVDSLADRVELQGVTVSDTAAKWLSDLWDKQKLMFKASNVHSAAVLCGDAHLVVWPDPRRAGVPVFYPQAHGRMAVRYDNTGEEQVIVEALKAWQAYTESGDLILRVTRYTPERTERYWSNDAYSLPDSQADLKPWDRDGDAVVANPYGRVPVFHFSNAQQPEQFGQSELKDVLPLQDLLNKSIIDVAVACEFAGFKQRWIAGIDIPVDPETGKPVDAFKSALDRVWTSSNSDTRYGAFEETNLEQLLSVVNDTRLEIARVSRTPLHMFMLQTGDFPSGEALKTAEGPLLNKVEKRQSRWGDVWEDAVAFAAEIAGVPLDESETQAQWRDTTPHSDKEQSEVAINKKAVGVSDEQLWRELGYDDATVQRMLEEKASRTEAMQTAFNSGITPGADQ